MDRQGRLGYARAAAKDAVEAAERVQAWRSWMGAAELGARWEAYSEAVAAAHRALSEAIGAEEGMTLGRPKAERNLSGLSRW
jgi:acyl-CoA reductase-like NAD-dependent aldehyde dehydrogenase